jgi:hypothetical protein
MLELLMFASGKAVAQLEERYPARIGVAGSSPVSLAIVAFS